jgi:hypothetical protein
MTLSKRGSWFLNVSILMRRNLIAALETSAVIRPGLQCTHAYDFEGERFLKKVAKHHVKRVKALTSGRCQMFISRSWVCCSGLNAPEMNAAVHRFMFIDFVFPDRLNLAAPTSNYSACLQKSEGR